MRTMTNRTQPTNQSVEDHLAGIEGEARRRDATALTRLMANATGCEPVMWGTSIVGFGTRHYVYDSGREGDTVVVGFAARKAALTIYGLFPDPHHANVALASRLGPHTHGKGCLYLKQLDGIDLVVLTTMVAAAYQTKTARPTASSGDQ